MPNPKESVEKNWFLADINTNDNPTLNLANVKIVLASGSEQRLALLKQIGIDPFVEISNFPENLDKSLPVTEFVQETAKFKGIEVVERLKKESKEFDVVVACDTVIHFNNEIIGKPTSPDDALQILRKLNNSQHSVFTGVALFDSTSRFVQFYEETQVVFGDIPDRVLNAYVATGEPMGRAGAYGIQLKGSALVKEIHGCYFNVVQGSRNVFALFGFVCQKATILKQFVLKLYRA